MLLFSEVVCYDVSVLVLSFMRVGVLVPVYVSVNKYGDGLRVLFCY